MYVVQTSEKTVRSEALELVEEILQLASHYLPGQKSMKLQALPNLFRLSANFSDATKRHSAIAALDSIDRLNTKNTKLHRQNLNSRSELIVKRTENAKLKLSLQIDENFFRQLLSDSEVLFTKDYNKWNWNFISVLVMGPLRDRMKFLDCIQNTKFVKRILSFFSPNKKLFSGLEKNYESEEYGEIGINMIYTLSKHPEGIVYLREVPLLFQIRDHLEELDPVYLS